MAGVVRYILLLLLLVLSGSAAAQGAQPPAVAEPAGRLRFDTSEGTWMALDVSPDGRTIAFDLLGDIYTLPVTGGAARPLMTGAAFETQPVFSPDGRRIAFVSDRSGAPNLWVCNLDGSGAVRLSADTGPVIYSSPAWSADGRFVYVSRLTHTALAFELYAYDAAGGTGTRITDARASEKHDDRVNTLGAVASPDGRYLYYARKTGALWSTKALPQWEVVRRDLRDGAEDRLIVSPGAAMRPALSHDGTRLVYASRLGAETGLRVRDLRSGADRWLTFPIDPDTQMGGYYNDLSPRVAFLPGDRELLTEIGGRITRVTLADGRRTPVPFTASVDIGVAPNTRVAVPDETGPVQVRIVQSPRWSPDGRRVVFAALGRLYVQMLGPGTTPQAVSGTTGMAFQPAWTPDGRGLVYVTWSATDGGAVWSIPAAGGTPKRLTADGAFYAEPAVSPDGRTLAVLRANQRERLDLASDLSPMLPTDVVAMPVGGGAAHVVVSRSGARALSFDRAGARLRFLAGNDLVSVASAGGETRREAVIGVPNGNRYFADVQVPPEDVRVSPDGGRMLIKAASQLYLANLPPASGGEPQRLDLNRLPVASAKLTALGADYADWSGDGAGILWSLGSTLRTVSAAGLLGSAPGAAEVKAARIEARVEVPRDVPDGSVVLRGGTAITMRGDEVIRGADVVVTGNRIAAVGRTGGVPVPAGAAIRDVSGRFIIPGFVDTHAHWFEIRRQLLDCGHWDFLANLAYGVTSALEVQPFTIDVFGYQDMIDAGMMIGPRAFSTGPGIFSNTPVDTVDDARNVLTRYRDYYRTRNIKSYMIGNRSERQRMVRATRELGMMATTEGASDFNLDLTHALDGFAGNEHNLPISPLRADVVALYAGARISYTPTLDILYGGKPPLDDMVIGGGMADDAKLRRFIPSSILESRLRGREWTPPADRFWTTFGADALRIRRAGGLVGIGSHGTVQGIGYHLEMALLAQSGATPFEVLRAATLDGAEIIGRKALIGSLEPGKYADLLILSADPLADLHNARAIEGVMKNGRLYDAATLAEVYPRPRPLPRQWFQEDAPSRADARPASAAAVRQAR